MKISTNSNIWSPFFFFFFYLNELITSNYFKKKKKTFESFAILEKIKKNTVLLFNDIVSRVKTTFGS